MKTRHKIKDLQIPWHILLGIMVITSLFPIVFAICNSFKTNQEAVNTVMSLIPQNPTIENYFQVFEKLPFVQITVNTFVIAIIVTCLKTITSLLAAYAFVYFTFKGKTLIYFIMLSTMFIPFTVTMIPNYLLISKLGLSDSIWGVMLPQFADVLGIFMLRQAMRGINKSLVEVAKLDNIGNFKILKDIVLPLARPAVISTGIIFLLILGMNMYGRF